MIPARLIFLAVFLFSLSANVAQGETAEGRPWQMTLATSSTGWSGGGDMGGSQSRLTGQMAYRDPQGRFGLSLTSRLANTDYLSPLSEDRFAITTPTDITFANYWRFVRGPFDIRAGVDIDLPTGKNAYSSTELAKLIIDPVSEDLMALGSFGAGLNFAPHSTITWRRNDRESIGFGFRYLISGVYDPTSDVAGDLLNPGDQLTLTLNRVTKIGADVLALQGIYTHAAADTQGGSKSFEYGDTFAVEARYIKLWSKNLRGIVRATLSTQSANQTTGEGGGLTRERANTNNNQIALEATLYERRSKGWAWRITSGYKQVAANGYGATDTLYDAGRQQFFMEPGFIHFVSNRLYLTGRIRVSQINDRADAFMPTDRAIRTWGAGMTAVSTF